APDHGGAVARAAAEHLVKWRLAMLADEVEESHIDRRFGGPVAVYQRLDEPGEGGRVVDLAAIEERRHEADGGDHALRSFAGHHRGGGCLAPADIAVAVGDAHDEVVAGGDSDDGELHRGGQRQDYGEGV